MNENKFIWSASFLSLLLHVVLAGIIWHTPLSVDSSVAQAEEVELFFLSEEDDRPTPIKMLTERAANLQAPEETPEEEKNPEEPEDETDHDLIAASLFDSRAADRVAGGEGTVARAQEYSEEQAVEIQKDEMFGAEGIDLLSELAILSQDKAPGLEKGEQGVQNKDQEGDDQNQEGLWTVPGQGEKSGSETTEESDEPVEDAPELKDWWGTDAPDLRKEGPKDAPGDRGFDFNQVEQGSLGAGVAYVGNYSMNTYEWAYSPWIRDWGNQLYRHWKSPYAYYRLGIIHGETKLRMLIDKNGQLLEVEILEKDGHESLHESSLAALKAFAPYIKLPEDFPMEYLELIVILNYPAFR